MENMVKAKPEITQAESGFKLVAVIVANPDFHQYFKPRKVTLYGTTLKDLQARQRQFIEEAALGISSEMPIGGGNWASYKTFVYSPEGKKLGRMSYNGTIWNEKNEEVKA